MKHEECICVIAFTVSISFFFLVDILQREHILNQENGCEGRGASLYNLVVVIIMLW